MLYFLRSQKSRICDISSPLRCAIFIIILYCSQPASAVTDNLLFSKIDPITTSHTLTPIEAATEFLTPKSLVLIDIDDCIMTPSSVFFHANSNERRLIKQLEKQKSSFSPFTVSLESFYLNAKYQLVHPKWPDIVNRYKELTPYVFLLSSKTPGSFVSIEKMELLVYNHLRKLKIEPNNLTINGQQYLKMNYTGVDDYSSIYYQGIILHGDISPNLVAGDLMYLTNLLPDKILYISPQQKSLKEVQMLAKKRKISFQGIKYNGAYNREGVPNAKLIALQKRILLEKQRWLEDEQLIALIQKQNTKRKGDK